MQANRFIFLAVPAAVAGTVLLTACNGSSDSTPGAKLTRLATVPLGAEVTGMYKTDNGDLFFNVQHPSDDLPAPENKAAVGVVNGLNIDTVSTTLNSVEVPAIGSEEAKTVQLAAGQYQALGRVGDTFSGNLPFGLGAIVNGAGNSRLKVSGDPDFNAFIPTDSSGNQGMLFTAWEDRPGAMSRLSLMRANGDWTVTDALNVDFSNVAGTMINCFGTLSPWGTPLTSEENYEAENTEQWNNPNYPDGYPSSDDVSLIQDYLGGTFPNPYDYGYIVEITQPTSAKPIPVKLFTLGRMAHENPVIMPDRATVYLTDDGTNKAFYKFVANTPGDLSAGTLYAAKLSQDAGASDVETAGFDIDWIRLGKSNNTEIKGWINEYNNKDRSDYVEGQTSYITQAEIDAWAANGSGDDRYAFLESLRAAKAKGATVEFRKMEGVNINYAQAAAGKVRDMYVAMSAVERGMSDSEGDIQVSEQKCGAVYRFDMDGAWNATRMEPVVVGGPYNGDAAVNRCALDNISNPDNLLILDDGRVLIGEDTGNHENNMIWIYNPNGQ